MCRLKLVFLAALLLAVLPLHAEIYKCTVDGKTVFKSGAVATEGCETHEIRAIPYDPKEAARTEEQLRRMDAKHRAFEAEQSRLRQERDQQLQQRQAGSTSHSGTSVPIVNKVPNREGKPGDLGGGPH